MKRSAESLPFLSLEKYVVAYESMDYFFGQTQKIELKEKWSKKLQKAIKVGAHT